MNSLYYVALTLHITAIVIFAGTVFMDFFLSQQFWKIYQKDALQAISIGTLIGKIQKIIGLSGLITILAGIWMMFESHWVWSEQLWFHLKMGLLILVLINAIGFRRRADNSMKKMMNNNFDMKKLDKLKINLTTIQVVQLLLILVMFTLSVFKFN